MKNNIYYTEAAIFDLDGVITDTARLHAKSWKLMFDQYLQQKDENQPLFDIGEDYLTYVDGKPRYEGVKSFLEARDIHLEYGSPDDEPGTETICGLGNRKNELFQQLLSEGGFDVYEDAVQQIRKWKAAGIRTAIVSSSKNCRKILNEAGLNDLFDARVDGITSQELKLAGKPEPDIFIEAAKMLKTDPARSIVFEDAISGVEAGKKGAFAHVVGVQRNGKAGELKKHGADIEIHDFCELELKRKKKSRKKPVARLAPALNRNEEIANLVDARRIILFINYEGVLTPYSDDPSGTALSFTARKTLERLALQTPVVIFSRKDMEYLRKEVDLKEVYYSACRGRDTEGPGLEKLLGEGAVSELNKAGKKVRQIAEKHEGVQVDRKRYGLDIHFGKMAAEEAEKLKKELAKELKAYKKLDIKQHPRSMEVLTDGQWDKGRITDMLLEAIAPDDPDVLPVFIGNDAEDEPVFEFLRNDGLGIITGDAGVPTYARYRLENPDEVLAFLHQLIDILDNRAAHNWKVVYDRYRPKAEPLREALCTLGNGYFASRGAAEETSDDGLHYPGTYLAGGYNRAESEIAGKVVENEDLVNWPNWLCLSFRIDEGSWFRIDDVEVLDFQQVLNIQEGILERNIRFRDAEGRETRLRTCRLVSQRDHHLAALEWTLEPQNWSGSVEIRSALDGRVTNNGVPRYRELNGKHLLIEKTGKSAENGIYVQARTTGSCVVMAQAARTLILRSGREATAERTTNETDGYIEHIIRTRAEELKPLTVEKTVAIYTSRDAAIADPLLEAKKKIARAGSFGQLLEAHKQAWAELWRRFDIEIEGDRRNQMILRLHIFHLLQTVSLKSIELDTGVPARGLHGEAYRGHIFWDEIYIFPFINLRVPELSRSLLLYRYRRLDEARYNARASGYQGAMFPWQSGSNGREESQVLHLNPNSGDWIPDNTFLQRHISADIVYNIIQYYEATADMEFLSFYGAELIMEVARFFSSLATWSAEKERYEICHIVGPDEYHTSYPGSDEPGINNNAYTNFMAAWVLKKALEILDLLEPCRAEELKQKLGIPEEELLRWKEVGTKMYIPFIDKKIINQFEGYEQLQELDWDKYHKQFGEFIRLDRILQAEDDDVNRYKASKQADVLMLFYLFTSVELEELFQYMGYDFDPELIPENIEYYRRRTSNGSTLSQLVHSWVLARSERKISWDIYQKALMSDFLDVQGGTTPEGIHLGAMAGTVDFIQRGYTGISIRDNVLWVNPELPDALQSIKLQVRYRGSWVSFVITHKECKVSVDPHTAHDIPLGFKSKVHQLKPGATKTLRLK